MLFTFRTHSDAADRQLYQPSKSCFILIRFVCIPRAYWRLHPSYPLYRRILAFCFRSLTILFSVRLCRWNSGLSNFYSLFQSRTHFAVCSPYISSVGFSFFTLAQLSHCDTVPALAVSTCASFRRFTVFRNPYFSSQVRLQPTCITRLPSFWQILYLNFPANLFGVFVANSCRLSTPFHPRPSPTSPLKLKLLWFRLDLALFKFQLGVTLNWLIINAFCKHRERMLFLHSVLRDDSDSTECSIITIYGVQVVEITSFYAHKK